MSLKKWCNVSVLLIFMSLFSACQHGSNTALFEGKPGEVKLMILDPGHFHADLLLKKHNDRINQDIFVYGPEGVGLSQHLDRVQSFNTRAEEPTNWNLNVYHADDFLKQMLENPGGNVVVLAGNNRKKPDYISQSVASGLHVLADKPLAINPEDFDLLKKSVTQAKKNKVMIYDMMTERFSILNILQRIIMGNEILFGKLEAGSTEDPSVKLQSIHHFYKDVAGKPLIRPAWYYDVKQQGEGLVDVTTHLIDIVHWKCFPEITLDYRSDVSVLAASHWPTKISPEQFTKSTQEDAFPDYLQDAVKNNFLEVYANGDMLYKVKGVHVGLHVGWNYEAPAGTGDTHTSIIRGSRSSVEVIQDESTGYVPELYIYPSVADADFSKAIALLEEELKKSYPEISLSEENGKIHVVVPQVYREAHEAHFAKVAETFFGYLVDGKMPAWEIPNMLAKYYITTTAYKLANSGMAKQ